MDEENFGGLKKFFFVSTNHPLEKKNSDKKSEENRNKNWKFTIHNLTIFSTIAEANSSYKDGVLLAEVPNGSKLLENVVVVEKKSENGTKNGNQNGQNTAEVIAGMKDQKDALENTTTTTTQNSGDYNYT